MQLDPDIETDFEEDEDEFFGYIFKNKPQILTLSTLLYSHGLTTRHAEILAADIMDRPDPMGDQQNLKALAERFEINDSTLRSHKQESETAVDDAQCIHYMLHETQRPKRLIATDSFSSHIDECDSVRFLIGRYIENADSQPEDESDEEYAIYLTKYENTGWNEQTYIGEEVRRVTGRRAVLDEINRILAEYQSRMNPAPIVGDLMHALDIPEGPLDPHSEYRHRISLIDPLNDPDGPPEGYEKPPHPFGNLPSLITRPAHEETESDISG